MYKIGMYGGCFNPLHLGHVNAIITAANQCEKLYVVMSNSKDPNEIDHKERLMWLKTVTHEMENVEVFEIFDNNDTKYIYDWESGIKQVKKHIKKKIDVIFAGSDYIGTNTWENAYPESKVIYLDRSEINVSSSEIRNNPFKYYSYLPKIVQKHFIKKVCVVGTESCGKSTLVRNLATKYNTSYVREEGRYVCDEAGGIDNMQKYHYYNILFRHKREEELMLDKANKVLFIDTDSLITLYYYKLDFGLRKKEDKEFEKTAESISKLNNYDLYIFLEPDVKWVQDGSRTYGDQKIREKNNKILKDLLKKNNIKYVSINGDYQNRYSKSIKLIDKLIGE